MTLSCGGNIGMSMTPPHPFSFIPLLLECYSSPFVNQLRVLALKRGNTFVTIFVTYMQRLLKFSTAFFPQGDVLEAACPCLSFDTASYHVVGLPPALIFKI